MGRLLSLVRGIESSLRSRLGRWMEEVSVAGDSAATNIASLQLAQAFITQDTWYVNATTGSDTNDGLTALTALQTLAEFERRTAGRTLAPSMTVFTARFDGAFPGQVLSTRLHVPGTTVLRFSGAMSVVASGTVSGFVPMDASTSTRAALTDAGMDFTPHLHRRVRLTSGVNVGAIAWICSLGGGVTVANTTDFFAPPAAGNLYFGAFVSPAPGDTYVVETFSTSCDAHQIVLTGIAQAGDALRTSIVSDISFVHVTGMSVNSESRAANRGLFVIYGCEYVSTGGNHILFNCVLSHFACAARCTGLWSLVYVGTNANEYSCGFFGVSSVVGGSNIFSQRNVHDGNGTQCVGRIVDAGATAVEIHHRGFFGNINGLISEHVRVQDNSAWVAEAANARFWGGAGNTVTNALRVFNNCSFEYVTEPTATGATPGQDVVLANEPAIAWGPALATPPNNAACNVRQ